MHYDRRQFLRRTAHAAIGLAATESFIALEAHAAEAPKPNDLPDLPIVDTHQHLWDLNKFRLPWLKSAGALNRSFLPKDYQEATRGLKIVKAVYMEVDVEPAQHVAEAEYIVELCRRGGTPTCAAVIGGRPGDDGFHEYVTRFKGNPYIRGVRQVLFAAEAQKPFFLEAPFIRDVRLLGELGMRFDLCLPAPLLAAGVRLLDQCPDTRFILDHCGNADVKVFQAAAKRDGGSADARRAVEQWRRDVGQSAQRKNVVCKISGIIATVPAEGWTPDDLAPIVNHCLDSFGPERVMFGGDWPVCTRGATLRRWVETLWQIVRGRKEDEQRKLFSENAVRFYGLT